MKDIDQPVRIATPIPTHSRQLTLDKDQSQAQVDYRRSSQNLSENAPRVFWAADNRRVERLSYFPHSNEQNSNQEHQYPIVELSWSTLKNSSSSNTTEESQRRLTSTYRSEIDQNFDFNPFYEQRYHTLATDSPSIRQTQFDFLPLTRSKHNRSSEQKSSRSDEQSRRCSIDLTILDSFLVDTMSKTTKGWQSSFSTKRDKFDNQDTQNQAATSAVASSFTTNGSMVAKKHGGLYKSASQGAIAASSVDDFHRRKSLLENAVDKRTAEAPNIQFQGTKNDLGSFWEDILRNREGTSTRTPTPNSGSQRRQMRNEYMSVDERNQNERRSTFHTGLNLLAERRAPFMKEMNKKYQSPSTSTSDRVLNTYDVLKSSMCNGSLNSNNDHETIANRMVTPMNGSSPNFSALDSAVAEIGYTSPPYISAHSGGCQRFPIADLSSSNQALRRKSFLNSSHSPSPDASSDTSSIINYPSGLPHPKPKHNIREQLIQAGLEPRGSGNCSYRWGTRSLGSTNFPVPSSGSVVASRISEFEKHPGAPNLLQIACALSGLVHIPQRADSPPMRSPVGPMSPRSSLYRKKPVIHADIGASLKSHTEGSNGSTPVFQFPCTNEEVPYYKTENAGNINDGLLVKNIAFPDDVILNSTISHQLDEYNIKQHNASDSEQKFQPLSIKERRLLRKASERASDKVVLYQPYSAKPPSINIPRFFFPKGQPVLSTENEADLRSVGDVFCRLGGKATINDMTEICKAANIPIYWKKPVFDSCVLKEDKPDEPLISLADFAAWWNRLVTSAHDEASRFIFTLIGSERNYLERSDFVSMLQDIIDSFPGLHFLREASEFHSRYIETVTVRIFWDVNRSWSGKITANELRRSNFLEVVRKLETTDDINTVTDYFSYEHFYVIYCKFYELDRDHDLIIDKADMLQHANGGLPSTIIDRIFSGAVTCSQFGKSYDRITYTDFVAFLLAEEDKKHPTSVEYWFRCLDLDGDGFISLYEMEYFYNGVTAMMDQHHIDSMRFEDVACNLLDCIQPRTPHAITLSDLKRSQLCVRFFNTFVNWVKFYEQESSEGERATVTDGEEELSDWDRYCLEEYEALMADDYDEPEDINLNLDDDDEVNGDVNTTVNLTLHDFDKSEFR